jgi:hypothetical protein
MSATNFNAKNNSIGGVFRALELRIETAIANIRVMHHAVAAFRRLATECGSRRMLSYYSRIEVRRIPGFHDRAAPVFEVAEVVEKQVSDAVL